MKPLREFHEAAVSRTRLRAGGVVVEHPLHLRHVRGQVERRPVGAEGDSTVTRLIPLQTLAKRLARGPTLAHAMTKRILRARARGGMEAADRVTREEAGELFESEDLIRAVDTFLEEGPGKARFEGR